MRRRDVRPGSSPLTAKRERQVGAAPVDQVRVVVGADHPESRARSRQWRITRPQPQPKSSTDPQRLEQRRLRSSHQRAECAPADRAPPCDEPLVEAVWRGRDAGDQPDHLGRGIRQPVLGRCPSAARPASASARIAHTPGSREHEAELLEHRSRCLRSPSTRNSTPASRSARALPSCDSTASVPGGRPRRPSKSCRHQHVSSRVERKLRSDVAAGLRRSLSTPAGGGRASGCGRAPSRGTRTSCPPRRSRSREQRAEPRSPPSPAAATRSRSATRAGSGSRAPPSSARATGRPPSRPSAPRRRSCPTLRASLPCTSTPAANSTMVDTDMPVAITAATVTDRGRSPCSSGTSALAREVVLGWARLPRAAARRPRSAAGGRRVRRLRSRLARSRPAIALASRAGGEGRVDSLPQRTCRGARIVGVADRAHDATRSAPARDDLADVAGVDAPDREERHRSRARPHTARGRGRPARSPASWASRAPGRRRSSRRPTPRRPARASASRGRSARPRRPCAAPRPEWASSWPTCTPSAAHAIATSGRSFTMNSAS